SVRKTGRLIVVQEDTENCSVGQMIISHISAQPELWSQMICPPILVSKGNVMIGYNPIYEYAALPDVARIVRAIERALSTRGQRRAPFETASAAEAIPSTKAEVSAKRPLPSSAVKKIVVPIMGEGIRSAKGVSLFKAPGDRIELDDALCEVETDKAGYPIESSYAGTMGQWLIKVDDTVEIGQELGTILIEGTLVDQQLDAAFEGTTRASAPTSGARMPSAREPALSATITRKLGRVVPANLQIDARWDAIRKARTAAKERDGDAAPSPSAMVAWTVVRAMEKHPAF